MGNTTTIKTDGPGTGVTLAVTYGRPMRAFLVVVGATIAVLPAWDLWHGLWPPSATLPVFAIIVIGGMAVGLTLLFAGIVGDSTILCAEDGWITMTRHNIFRREIRAIAPSDITRIAIRPIEWDSRPATFSVEVTLRTGGRVGSQDFATAAEARHLARQFARAAGRPDLASET